MPDLKALAAELRRWQQSCQEVGDSYDEQGLISGAHRHWGKAEGFKVAAEMLDHEVEREARDA